MNPRIRRHRSRWWRAGSAALLLAAFSPALARSAAQAPGAAAAPAARRSTKAEPAAALALLIAIDDYLQPADKDREVPRLHGAHNDAVRVRELLQTRFGFAPNDILTLAGPAATHEAIVRAFHEHLIRRSGPATRVVIWYSGHGSRVPDPSGQDPSQHDDFEDPHDNTWITHDSRAGDRDGSYDFTDDELHSLLAVLPARDVVLVADCCHSGGLLRGASTTSVRHASAGRRPLDRAAIAPFWPGEVPFRDDDRVARSVAAHTVFIAACSSTQEAGEFEAPDGRMYGTLTWFLTSALLEVDKDTSWQRVTELVRARIAGSRAGTRPNQLVSCSDDRNRTILGGTGRPLPPGFAVHPRGGQLWIEAGRVHGIGEGTELRLFDLDDREHGTARVFRATATGAEADWVSAAPLPAELALRAAPRGGLQGRAPLRIRCAMGVDPALVHHEPWSIACADGTHDYVAARRDGRLVLQTAEGTAHVLDADAAAAREAMFKEHRWRSLWEGLAQTGRHRIGLEVRAATPEDGRRQLQRELMPAQIARLCAIDPARALVGAVPLPEQHGTGMCVTLVVTNRSDEPLHVAVLSVAEDRAVHLILGRTTDNLLQPGRSRELLVEVGPSPGWPLPRPMLDRYLAIATPRFADFRPFESSATLADRPEPTRGGDQEESMPDFLRSALAGGLARGAPAPVAPAWGIQWLDLELVPPDRFAALCEKR